MIWLLDTNVLIQAQKGRPGGVRERLAACSPDDVAISAITVAELWYGIQKSNDPERTGALWRRFLGPFAVLPFDGPAGEQHGRLRYALRHTPIGERDLLIAAIAIAHDLIVVTSNTREFSRVAGLRIEDWSD